MVNLTRIYTKTGDDGSTSLGDMSRTSKNDPRLEAYADVDEANSAIGTILALGELMSDEIRNLLMRIQNDLFDVGADLCTPVVDEPKVEPLRVLASQTEYIERQIDLYNDQLSPLRSFVLPGGTRNAALTHQARTVVRRAERRTWAAIHAYANGVNPESARYLNRLSDLLFVLARYFNLAIGDVLWQPGANR